MRPLLATNSSVGRAMMIIPAEMYTTHPNSPAEVAGVHLARREPSLDSSYGTSGARTTDAGSPADTPAHSPADTGTEVVR